MSVPSIRIARANEAPLRAEAGFVLYWMIAGRRTRHNFALDRAIELGRELGRPLVVLEALRLGYDWASDRLHAFVVEGMADNADRLGRSPVRYVPYVERRAGDGRGLLEALAACACAVVTDEAPMFFLPRMVRAAADRLPVRLETVDSNGLLPLRATDRDHATAYSFRRVLQRELPDHLEHRPVADPLDGLDLPTIERWPAAIGEPWPEATPQELRDGRRLCTQLELDHEVEPVGYRGGEHAGRRQMRRFLGERLPRYADGHNHPDDDAVSELSPWLHFGHVAVHEIFAEIAADQGWSPADLGAHPRGKRRGWWGMGEAAEAFLDELVTWRELGYGVTFHRPGYDRYESLPEWARRTLEDHADDRRPYTYSLEELEQAATHDEVWNAAQRQLLRDGRIHNYLRMLWGKKILEWTPGPRDALDLMVELNNRWAVDGRDPNSYSGIFWVLGRHDRAWGPERDIFGKVRYMSSVQARKKLRMGAYLERWGEPEAA